jgi:hypothetical protein
MNDVSPLSPQQPKTSNHEENSNINSQDQDEQQKELIQQFLQEISPERRKFFESVKREKTEFELKKKKRHERSLSNSSRNSSIAATTSSSDHGQQEHSKSDEISSSNDPSQEGHETHSAATATTFATSSFETSTSEGSRSSDARDRGEMRNFWKQFKKHGSKVAKELDESEKLAQRLLALHQRDYHQSSSGISNEYSCSECSDLMDVDQDMPAQNKKTTEENNVNSDDSAKDDLIISLKNKLQSIAKSVVYDTDVEVKGMMDNVSSIISYPCKTHAELLNSSASYAASAQPSDSVSNNLPTEQQQNVVNPLPVLIDVHKALKQKFLKKFEGFAITSSAESTQLQQQQEAKAATAMGEEETPVDKANDEIRQDRKEKLEKATAIKGETIYILIKK